MFRSIILVLILFISGCKSSSHAPKNVLRISFSIFPSTLDPRKSGDFISATMISLIYEGLTRCLPDGTSEPALAERIELSEDQKTYTFHLRESYWTDGAPVTAHDFERTWKQAIDPKFPALCSYLFFPIENAEEAFLKKATVDQIGIKALDDKTLRVTLKRPTPHFLSLTAFPSFLPLPQHRIHEDEPKDPRDKVINGPFRIEQMTPHASIVLRKNQKFWAAKELRLDGIEISIIPNEMTAFSMFENGELDWLGGLLSSISPDAISAVNKKTTPLYFPMAASTFFVFNTSAIPFSNENIRKAFSLSIDRDEIASKILPTRQLLATRCIPPALCGGENRNTLLGYDPEAAKKHLELGLEELGLTREEISPITFYFRSGLADRLIAQVIQSRWKSILGIDILLCQTDFGTHGDRLRTRNFSVALANWIAQYHDPINILERFKSSINPKNYAAWDDPEFATLLVTIQDELDPVKRMALIEKAEDLISEHVPILPIYHWTSPSLCHPRLRNIHTTPSGGVLFEKSYLVEELDEEIPD